MGLLYLKFCIIIMVLLNTILLLSFKVWYSAKVQTKKNNLPEVVKALSQYLHLWGFVPVWVLTWFCREANVLKPLSQTLHLWGRSSECDFMCRDRRYLVQNPRLNGFNNYYYMSTPICTPIDTSYHLVILIICQPTFLG